VLQAIFELIATEADYVRDLQLIVEVSCLEPNKIDMILTSRRCFILACFPY